MAKLNLLWSLCLLSACLPKGEDPLAKRSPNAGDNGNGVIVLPPVSNPGSEEHEPAPGAQSIQLQSGEYGTTLNRVGSATVYMKDCDPISGSVSDISLLTSGERSAYSFITRNGRYVVYSSRADQLNDGQHAGIYQVYLHDLATNTVELISTSDAGLVGNDHSYSPQASDDGRFVSYYSFASNLAGPDSNHKQDVFLRDRKLGKTLRLSLGPKSSESNGASYGVSISASGNLVSFSSDATNLGINDQNGSTDVFYYETATGTLRQLAFETADGKLVGAFNGILSPDGQWIVVQGGIMNPSNRSVSYGFFRVNVSTGSAQLLRDVSGIKVEGTLKSVSNEARQIVFLKGASIGPIYYGGYDLFLFDSATANFTLISKNSEGVRADQASSDAAITPDGRYVAFISDANNLVPDINSDFIKQNLFLLDRAKGTISLIADNVGGATASFPTGYMVAAPSIAANLTVAFTSYKRYSGCHNNYYAPFVYVANPRN